MCLGIRLPSLKGAGIRSSPLTQKEGLCFHPVSHKVMGNVAVMLPDNSLNSWHLKFRLLVAQWLRVCLPIQGTRVRALVREDPTCCGATKPVSHNDWACALEPASHNYWACTLEPVSHNYWACVLRLLKPVRLEPVLCDKRSHRNEKPAHHNEE